jgi:hypothetical protein
LYFSAWSVFSTNIHGGIKENEWVIQAREFVRIASNKSDLLKRIRDRKERIGSFFKR